MDAFKDCGVCFMSYDSKEHAPRILPCGHSLCSPCLMKTISSSHLKKCPFDNYSLDADQNSLAGFPLNFALLSFLEQKNSKLCKTHPKKKLKFICLTDETKICSKCMKHGDHKDHEIKKVKKLKDEGAKAQRDLKENLLQMKDYEQNQEEDHEERRKVLIKTIDDQFIEIQNIVVDQQLAVAQQINNLFDAIKKNDSESIFMHKHQMDEMIKDITYASKDEHTNLILLNKLINNKEIIEKLQSLKERYSRNQNKVLDMQRVFQASLNSSKTAIRSLQFSDQKFLNEFGHPLEKEQQFPTQIPKVRNDILLRNSKASFTLKKTSEGLEIVIGSSELNQVEINADDLKGIEKVAIHLKRYDKPMEWADSSNLQHILRQLERFTLLEVSIDPEAFEMRSLKWIANIISENIGHITSLSFDLEKCEVQPQRFQALCNLVFSKAKSLKGLFLHLSSSGITGQDLTVLVKSLDPFHKDIEFFALGLANTNVSANGLNQVFEMIQSMRKLKDLQLIFSGANIHDWNLKRFGERVLLRLHTLSSLELCLQKTDVSNQGMLPVLKNLPNLKILKLYLSETKITDHTANEILEHVLPELNTLELFLFVANKTLISGVSLEKIREASESLNKMKHMGQTVDEIFNSQEIEH